MALHVVCIPASGVPTVMSYTFPPSLPGKERIPRYKSTPSAIAVPPKHTLPSTCNAQLCFLLTHSFASWQPAICHALHCCRGSQ